MMDEYYFISQTGKDTYTIAKFSDYKEPDSVWSLREEPRSLKCGCPGAWRSRTCRHMKLFNFWKDKLDKRIGFMLWLEGNEIEYKRVFDFKKVNDLLAA